MFKNILLAVDGSEMAEQAAAQGMQLAKRLGATVTIVTVTLPWETYYARELAVVVPGVVVPEAEYDAKRKDIASDIMRHAWANATSLGLSVSAIHRCDSAPYKAIIDVATEKGCDLIVVGSHCDQGLIVSLPGSEAMKIVTHSTTIPVLIYRPT